VLKKFAFICLIYAALSFIFTPAADASTGKQSYITPIV